MILLKVCMNFCKILYQIKKKNKIGQDPGKKSIDLKSPKYGNLSACMA